jgi:hypothetical protein
MSDIFSEEMKKEIVKLFDKRLHELKVKEALDDYRSVCMSIDLRVKDLNERLVDVEDNTNDFENQLDGVATKHDLELIHEQLEHLENYVQHDELEDVVGKTMLKLMPNFNEKISKEIKKHLVAIAEFVIKNFKEKE